jgi:hypothetical protein
MGYAVLNIKKASGNDAATSAHIERTIDPKNADKTRTHLNKELIHFPDGVSNRTEAIQYRIKHAGITRKINEKQVWALRLMLTGSPEDMQRIQSENRLDEWCRDNLEWVRETFGNDNLVSAVLHMDEKTPHIHATVVPIVTGERRKAKATKPEDGRKKYRKKNPNAARLCADDVMARDKLESYQDSYAERMQKYGLQRGVRDSEAKNINTQQFYRELYVENEHLKKDIQEQKLEQQEVYDKVRDLYDRKDEAREKFLDLDRHVRDKKEELATIETKLQKAKQDYEPYRTQEELNRIHELFPMMKEQLRIADFCRKVGLAVESIKALLTGKTLTAKAFSFFSPEHKQKFSAENVKLKIESEPDNPNKLRLNLNGMSILEWFRQRFQEVKFSKKPEISKNRGIKM